MEVGTWGRRRKEREAGVFSFLVFGSFIHSMTSELFSVYSTGIVETASLSKSYKAAKQHLICYQTRKLFLPKDT